MSVESTLIVGSRGHEPDTGDEARSVLYGKRCLPIDRLALYTLNSDAWDNLR